MRKCIIVLLLLLSSFTHAYQQSITLMFKRSENIDWQWKNCYYTWGNQYVTIVQTSCPIYITYYPETGRWE